MDCSGELSHQMDLISSLEDQVFFDYILKLIICFEIKYFLWLEMHYLRYRIVSINNKNVEVHLLFAFVRIIFAGLSGQVSKPCTNVNANMPLIKTKIWKLVVVNKAYKNFIIFILTIIRTLIEINWGSLLILIFFLDLIFFSLDFLIFLIIPIVDERFWV